MMSCRSLHRDRFPLYRIPGGVFFKHEDSNCIYLRLEPHIVASMREDNRLRPEISSMLIWPDRDNYHVEIHEKSPVDVVRFKKVREILEEAA